MAQIEVKFLIDDTEPDDIQLMKRLGKISDMYCALFEIRYNLVRNIERVCDSDEKKDPIVVMREMFGEIFDEFNITEDLI